MAASLFMTGQIKKKYQLSFVFPPATAQMSREKVGGLGTYEDGVCRQGPGATISYVNLSVSRETAMLSCRGI